MLPSKSNISIYGIYKILIYYIFCEFFNLVMFNKNNYKCSTNINISEHFAGISYMLSKIPYLQKKNICLAKLFDVYIGSNMWNNIPASKKPFFFSNLGRKLFHTTGLRGKIHRCSGKSWDLMFFFHVTIL